jgi:hypothetical protein
MSIAQTNTIAKVAAVVAGLGLVAMSFVAAAPAKAADMFTMDLTVGSMGADVTALQTWLIAQGYSIPAGATGYFGMQTKAAVAAYQAAKGIVPAVGYFGPKTRASVNAGAGGVGPVVGNGELKGGEASINVEGNLGDVESDLNEGDEENILGVELEAEDGDISIERVDVDIDLSDAASGESSNLDDYVTEVAIMLDGKKLGSLDVDEADEDDDVFSFRFTGLKGIIREDDTAELYVVATAVDNIDSDDTAVVLTVDVPADGIRAVDGTGISETYVTAGEVDAESFSIEEAEVGDLDLTEGEDNPEASVVSVDDEDDTDEVTILEFDLEANDSGVVITDLPVGLVTSENEGVDGPVKRVMLVMDGETLDTVSIPASAGTSYQALFEDIDVELDENDTATFQVVVDLNDTDVTTFATGTTLYATTTGSNAAWDVEDDQGEEVTPDGSVTGELMTFHEDTVEAELVSATASRIFTADDAGEADQAQFKIKFDVTALGEDMYIDRTVTGGQLDGVGAAGSGFQWATTSDSTTGTSTSASISAADSDSSDTTTLYKINEGDTRTFTLTVTATASQDGYVGVQLTGINWTTTAGDSAAPNFYTSHLEDFKTDLEFVQFI